MYRILLKVWSSFFDIQFSFSSSFSPFLTPIRSCFIRRMLSWIPASVTSFSSMRFFSMSVTSWFRKVVIAFERGWSRAFIFVAPRAPFIIVRIPMSPTIDGGYTAYLFLSSVS